jgi:hypothetical protein
MMQNIRNPALIVAIVILTVAAFLFLYMQQVGGAYQTVIFPLMVLFYRVLPLAIFVLLPGIAVLVLVWIVLAVRRRSRAFIVPILLLVISAPLLCFSSLGMLADIKPRASAQFDGQIYQVALRRVADGDHSYIFYVCDGQGWRCTSVYEERAYASSYGKPEPEIALIVDETAKTVTFQLANEVVYVYNKT